MSNVFLYMGYDSFLQWLTISLIDNLFWIIILGPPAVLLWKLCEDNRYFRLIVRWVQKKGKPGPHSYKELYRKEAKAARKLRKKVRDLQLLTPKDHNEITQNN